MPLFPDARAVVTIGWDCEMIGAYADTNATGNTHGHLDDRTIQYAMDVADLAEQAGFRMQYFLLGQTFEGPVDWAAELLQRGHAFDQHTYSHFPLISDDEAEVARELAETSRLFEQKLGFRPVGLRGPGGYAHGLHDHPRAQQIVKEQGLTFVSSHYATKSPSGPYDVYADKNAHQIIKHHQPRQYPNGLLEMPICGYTDRHFLDNLARPVEQFTKHLQDCLDFAYDMGGLLYTAALHPDTMSRHDPQLQAVTGLIEHAQRKADEVRFVTYREVAEAALAVED